MVLVYSGKSAPSAREIEYISEGDIIARRRHSGDINWGRARANTELNPDISNSTNKRVMRELFEEHGVPSPKLYYCPYFAIDQGIKLVGRPDRHMKGRGLWRCDTRAGVRRAFRGTRRKKAATHFMQYIDAPRELRVHIFQGKSIRISEKLQGSHGETAHGGYTTIKPTGPVRHVRKAAKAAVEALGLDFGCVDVLANDTQAWCLEVNAAPGLGGTMPRTYCKAFLVWYETFKNWRNG